MYFYVRKQDGGSILPTRKANTIVIKMTVLWDVGRAVWYKMTDF
jgi:hypothetical protein